MRDGEIVQEGSPEEIVTLPTDQYVTEFVRDVSRAKVIQAKAVMREPDAVVYERQGPRAALHTMDSHGLDAVFLIARNFTLRGILTEEQAKAVAAVGKETLEEAPVTPALTTSPEAYLEDIIPIAAKSEHPVAVGRPRESAWRDPRERPAYGNIRRRSGARIWPKSMTSGQSHQIPERRAVPGLSGPSTVG